MQVRQTLNATVAVLLGLAAACAGPAATDEPAPLLPAPSVLRASAGEVESECYLLGRQYETSWASNRAFTYASEDYLNLAGVQGGGRFAFAGYALDAPAGSFEPSVYVETDGAAQPGELWLGLADFTRDSWSWQSLDESGVATFDPARHLSGDAAYAYIVYTGSAYLKVHSIRLGALTPPFIEDVLPRIGVAGATRRFSVATAEDGQAQSCVWNFGGAAVPSISYQLQPLVELQAPGTYSCSVTASNAAGDFSEDFTVRVVAAAEYLPQTLYAIPAQTSAQTGEAVTVRVVTGELPADAPLRTVYSIGLTVDGDGEYVSGSYNIGAPGGAAHAVDGVWSTLSIAPEEFIALNEDYLGPVATDVPGQQLFIFNVVPVNGGTTTEAGDLFNFQLRFSAPGAYSLGFRASYEYERTYYSDAELHSRRWYDISNDHPEYAHQIVVAD